MLLYLFVEAVGSVEISAVGPANKLVKRLTAYLNLFLLLTEFLYHICSFSNWKRINLFSINLRHWQFLEVEQFGEVCHAIRVVLIVLLDPFESVGVDKGVAFGLDSLQTLAFFSADQLLEFLLLLPVRGHRFLL